MKKRITAILAFCGIFALGASAGWEQERDDAARLRSEAERSPRTTPYRLGGETIPATPELAVNIHKLDDPTAELLKKANFKTVRQTIYWYRYEKTPGVYDEAELKQLDERMALYRRHGLTPLVMIHGNAPGANFANRLDSYRRFGAFTAMLAKRYPDVRYFQLWNEMDGAFTDLFGARTPKLPMAERGKYYAEMLKIVTPMIRAANPAALIVTGGMTNWTEFPAALYENGAKEYFDIMAVHTYGMPVTWAFISRGVKLRRLMDQHGDRDKPLWNTEFGVSAEAMIRAWGIPKENALEYFDDKQASQLNECVAFNRKARVFSKYFIYAWHAGSEAPKDVKEKLSKQLPGVNFDDISFSLIRKDGTPRRFLKELIEATRKTSAGRENGGIAVENGRLIRNGEPFFPVGLVFGRTDEAMQRAKAAGFNSIHQEYSLRDVLPDGPDTVSEAGVQRIRDLHETARRNGMVLFPQLTGHYIPGWLAETAGPAPVDPNGKKTGLLKPPVRRRSIRTVKKSDCGSATASTTRSIKRRSKPSGAPSPGRSATIPTAPCSSVGTNPPTGWTPPPPPSPPGAPPWKRSTATSRNSMPRWEPDSRISPNLRRRKRRMKTGLFSTTGSATTSRRSPTSSRGSGRSSRKRPPASGSPASIRSPHCSAMRCTATTSLFRP